MGTNFDALWAQTAGDGQQSPTSVNQSTPADDDWKIWQTGSAADTNSQHGVHPLDSALNAIGNWWDQVKHGPANLYDVGKGLGGLATGDTEKSMLDTTGQLWNKAKTDNQGDYVAAAGHALNYALSPLIGSSLDDAGEQFSKGNVSGGIGKTLGAATNILTAVKAPQIASGIANIPEAAAFKADPALDLISAYGPRDPRFINKVPDAAADIKAANANRVQGNEDVIAAAPKARDMNRQAWNAWINRAQQMGAQASGDPVVTATQNSIADTVDPASSARILDEASRIYGGPLAVDKLAGLLQEKNGELKPFYSKDEATRSAAEAAGARTGRSQALLEAQSKAIRETLYNLLDPENGGAGPREIQQRYGAISSLEDQALANRNQILAEHAGTPAGKVAKTAAAILSSPGKAVTGNVEGALMDVPAALHGKTDPIIARAFRNVGSSKPLPMPPATGPQQWVGTGRGAKALPAASVLTPPPSDASYVRGVPAQTAPPNPARALPPASTHFTGPVPDQSGVRGVPAQPPFRVGFPQKALPPGGQSAPQYSPDTTLGGGSGDIVGQPQANFEMPPATTIAQRMGQKIARALNSQAGAQ